MKNAIIEYVHMNILNPQLIGLTNQPYTANKVAISFVIIADQSRGADGFISQK
jgi:hypothetical protein